MVDSKENYKFDVGVKRFNDTSCTVIKSDRTWVHIGYSNGVSPDNQKSMNNFLEYFSSIHAYDAI
ncbi:hypothetical protein pdam_00009041 [Pocillopora damicornis]|uniref:Uncharacterized protein n=1 Tax=Pocillopora damicornis TaxID=46731 RepID=A0A3M6T9C7_POCDA|nr:hypothetical protein pdam_00009041 [Pocillopora damicornis]